MTDREKAIVMTPTGICMLEGEKLDAFYEYLAELYGRPVYTHEWLTLDIQEKSKPDFLELCREEERKTGRWITVTNNPHWNGGGYWKCSSCGYGFAFGAYHEADEWHYCPNCGAKMEVEHEGN